MEIILRGSYFSQSSDSLHHVLDTSATAGREKGIKLIMVSIFDVHRSTNLSVRVLRIVADC